MLWLSPDVRLFSACLVKRHYATFCSSKFLWIFPLAWEPSMALARHWNLVVIRQHKSLKNFEIPEKMVHFVLFYSFGSDFCFFSYIFFETQSKAALQDFKVLRDLCFTEVTGVSSKSCSKCSTDRVWHQK